MTDANQRTTPARMRAACVDFWGQPQTQKTVVPGVIWYTTAGHGGVVVSDELFPLKQEAKDEQCGNVLRWENTSTRATVLEIFGFEEDEDWAVLLFHHPELAEPMYRKVFAHLESVDDLMSHVRMLVASKIRYAAEREAKKVEPELWAKSAWGDWAEDVPEGQVKVLTMADTVVFMPKDQYKPGERGFGYTEGA